MRPSIAALGLGALTLLAYQLTFAAATPSWLISRTLIVIGVCVILDRIILPIFSSVIGPGRNGQRMMRKPNPPAHSQAAEPQETEPEA